MTRAGVVGLGDMGSGLARNLMQAGFSVAGFDVAASRMAAFSAADGLACADAAEVGRSADAVFVMVMTGAQAKSVILGEGGLSSTMASGGVVLLTATIEADIAREIGDALSDTELHLIDSPVSGGYPGAQNGTLTMMAAGSDAAMAAARPVMEAVSGTIRRVGREPGEGQTVKACLQSLIGAIFTATFEASVLAAKAGVSGQVLYDVFSTSGAGCGITKTALENIIDRKFAGTGSHIATMYKDLGLSLGMARSLGVPLHTATTAAQLFQAGQAKYPDGDNQAVTRVIEEIVGAELHRNEARR